MTARASWKGFLKLGELSCPVALYTAISTSERVALTALNRSTGHRVLREVVDSETGGPVERDDQMKGYESSKGKYVFLEAEEIASAIPNGDKLLDMLAFIGCGEVDDLYFDKPYYLKPADPGAAETFALIRDGIHSAKVAAISQAVVFRRVRTVLIRSHGGGLVATALNFDYEIRASEEIFGPVRDVKITDEMLDLAKHIIHTKQGRFDAAEFHDRYDTALADLVKAKLQGNKVVPLRPPKPERKLDLLSALRESADLSEPAGRSKAAARADRRPLLHSKAS